MVREALAILLNANTDLEITHSTQSVSETLHTLSQQAYNIDVAVVDVRLHDGTGHDITREISSRYPHIKVVLLTSFLNDEDVVQGYSNGASALILKGASTSTLITAIKDAAAGLYLINPVDARVAAQRLQQKPNNALSSLSETDQQIARHISYGLSDKEIAETMHFSVQTVKNRVSRILRLLHLDNRTQLAVLVATESLHPKAVA